ncbi:hypothetical protein GBA52_019041 [Prunus armeniaca]|nr:hypothetical protein GBA52_019041 [Prunus armeniaca]
MVRASALKPSSKFFLRKHRKWPVSPHNTKWHQTFNQNQAFQSLKKSSPPQNQPQHLLSTLIYSFNSYNCEPNPEAYNFVIKTLTKTSQFNDIASVLDRLESVEKFNTPEYIFAHLISFYGQAKTTQDAIDLFYRIPKFREGLKMVPEILLRSHIMSIRLEESSFQILVNSLCGIGKVGYAIEIMNCMISYGYGLNVKMCSLILSSLCEQKDSSGFEVLGFVEEMKKLGFCPGMMDYSNVIRYMVKQGRGLDALNVLVKMKVEGIKPDIVCYTMVLHGVIAKGDYENADELFDELLLLGLVPDVYTYNVYVNGLCKQNKVKDGLKMISSMEELGFDEVIYGLCRKGSVCKAMELLKKMVDKNVAPGAKAWEALLLSSGSEPGFAETTWTDLVNPS